MHQNQYNPVFAFTNVWCYHAETLFRALHSVIERDDIPPNNIIDFAAYTTNVMFEEHNSVVSCLKEKIPNIFLMCCICHTAHLCASHACEKHPWTADMMCTTIFAIVPEEFLAFQYFSDVEPCQTHWLSLHSSLQQAHVTKPSGGAPTKGYSVLIYKPDSSTLKLWWPTDDKLA